MAIKHVQLKIKNSGSYIRVEVIRLTIGETRICIKTENLGWEYFRRSEIEYVKVDGL